MTYDPKFAVNGVLWLVKSRNGPSQVMPVTFVQSHKFSFDRINAVADDDDAHITI